MKYILIFSLIIMILTVSCQERNDSTKFTVCWIEKSEAGGEGNCRHNGILTDSGYIFTDTIYNHTLKKKVVLTTLVQITKSSY